jgi:hypothetical protein
MQKKLTSFSIISLVLFLLLFSSIYVLAANYKAFVVFKKYGSSKLLIADAISQYVLSYNYQCYNTDFTEGGYLYIDTILTPMFWNDILVNGLFGTKACKVSSATKVNLKQYFVDKTIDNKDEIIIEDASGKQYLVDYGIGCSLSMWRYEGKYIYIDTGGIFLNGLDKIYLFDSDDECSVMDVEDMNINSSIPFLPSAPASSSNTSSTTNINSTTQNSTAATPVSSTSTSNNPQITSQQSSTPTHIDGYSLVKTSASSDVYAIYANTKRKIRSIDIFNSYDWPNQKVTTVSQASLDSTSDTNLIKTPDNPNVYIFEKGFKRLLASVDIFNSYGLDWNKVVTMNQKEMDSYQIAPLIKHGYAFYWLDTQRVKHMFPSTDSLATNGYDEKDAIIVNDLEFGSYADGLKINK